MKHEPVTDPFAKLMKDHKTLAGYLKEATDTTERAEKTRTELFAKIYDAFMLHAELEEACLYPVLEDLKKTHGLTLEAEEEHHAAKIVLAEMQMTAPTEDVWTAKLTVFKEDIDHHVEEEETTLFPKAKSLMSETQIAGVAAAMNAFLDERPG